MVHLVNFDLINNPSVKNIEISLKIQGGKKVSQLLMFSPDDEDKQSLDFSVRNGRVVFTVPELMSYNLVVIKLK